MSDGVPGTPLYITAPCATWTASRSPARVLDVWQADPDGAYEAQLDVDEARLRAKYTAREDGSYCVRTVAPKGYAIPMDGPVGDLIGRTEISHFRPAHVHFLIDAPGYRPLITHLFQEGAQYLDSDVVFGTKAELVVAFDPRDPGPTPDGGTSPSPGCEARYDFVLQPVGPPDPTRCARYALRMNFFSKWNSSRHTAVHGGLSLHRKNIPQDGTQQRWPRWRSRS